MLAPTGLRERVNNGLMVDVLLLLLLLLQLNIRMRDVLDYDQILYMMLMSSGC